MTLRESLISAVDHVIEPPDLWTRRLSKVKFAERMPHVEKLPDGSDCWVIDCRKYPLSETLNVGALLNDRAIAATQWSDVPKTAYEPAARSEAMDQDGIAYSVLYPTLAGFSGERFGAIADPELALACAQAYNDWLIEEWHAKNSRFIPQSIVPIHPIDAAVGEIRRAVGRGHRGLIFPTAPMQLGTLPHINASDYDPIWATCQDLDVPVCFRAGSTPDLFQFPLPPHIAPELAAAMRAAIRPASAVFDLTNILFSRILLRFPKLKVIFAESSIGWGTYLLEYADHQYEQDHCNYELKPSEMFHRQCYLTAWYDEVDINSRHVGVDNILWATNFPAANSTWPDTRQFTDRRFAGMEDHARRRIQRDNAAKLYKIAA
ncbi:MAG: amidohydrolase [Deltaproteobacteria bacterium]|nr:amidohydrolase [Deltaproteobacteria bacterium]